MNIEKLSSKFKQLMQKNNVNGALRLLTNKMSNAILPLSDKTLQILSPKHPEVQQAHHEAILQGLKRQMHSIVYEDIDEDLIKKVALKTKGGCDPAGHNVDNCRRILVFTQFGSSSLDLRTSIANFAKRLFNTNIHLSNSGTDNSLEVFMASPLIPLNKNQGLCRICVGEVLRRIAGKVVMYMAKKDVKDAAGSLQARADQEVHSEATIHVIYDVYQQDETEDVFLVDADNAFNSINRKAMLHNISITCFLIRTFIANCYMEKPHYLLLRIMK